MIHVVALLARAGHGKTTIAHYLRDTYGARIISLATPLKKIAQATMGFSDEQLYGTQEEKEAVGRARSEGGLGLSARVFLQRLGTEGMRTFINPNVFLNTLIRDVAKDYAEREQAAGHSTIHKACDAVYIVDDARFPNEAEFFHYLDRCYPKDRNPIAFFGSVIKIVCTDAPPSGDDSHSSESGVDAVREHLIDAIVTSSRAAGTEHLIDEVEAALRLPPLAGLRGALVRSRADRRAAA